MVEEAVVALAAVALAEVAVVEHHCPLQQATAEVAPEAVVPLPHHP